MADIAFIGLGNMGLPMARNLLKAGHTLRVFDLVPEAKAAAVADGAHGASSALDAARGVEVVISMLPAGRHVAGLYLGDDGLLANLSGHPLIVDCSTIDAATARQVAQAASARQLPMLDAPVSGGTGGASAGTLTFIVGGEADDLERARPVLEDMGRNIFHAGGAGAGQVAKMCNNMLLSVLMAGTAEALQLGVANGLDPAVLSNIMKSSSGSNWALQVYNPWPGVMPDVPADNDYQGGFMVDLMVKDLGLALQAATASGSATPLGALARNLFALHQANGAGALDFSSIQRLFSAPK